MSRSPQTCSHCFTKAAELLWKQVGAAGWFLLAQFGVDGKNFGVTDEGEGQDGDGVRGL